jgi:hypothetical protein
MKSNLTKALLFLTAGISGLSIAFAADKAMANDLPDNTYFRLRTNTGSYVNKSGNILAPVSGANTLSKLTDSNVMYVKSRGPNGSAELANATSTNTCLGLATGLDVNAINTNSKVVYLSCDKAFNWQLTTGKLSLAITNGKFCLVTAADKRGSGQPLSIELCNSNSPVRYRVQSNTNDSDPIGFMLPPVVVPPVVVPPVVVPPVVVPPPVVPPVVVPPVVVPPKANQSDQLVNGQFFVFLNQTLNQPMNVRGGANGTKINGSPATIDFDKEMITKVGIKPNSNIIQIEANGKVVSVKENSVSGSLLETYNKVGYFDPYQSFYHDTLPNGNIILTSVKYPHLAINLKYGGKNEQFAPYMLWDKNGIEKDTDLQFKAKSIPGYVEKQVIDDPITENGIATLQQIQDKGWPLWESHIIKSCFDLKASKAQCASILGNVKHETDNWNTLREYDGPNQAIRYGYSGGSNFYGRGFIQLTHNYNYLKFQNITSRPLVSNPDLMITDLSLSSWIAVYGCLNGTFTGARLDAYVNNSNTDFYNARRVINGTDKADVISGYSGGYLNLLNIRGY